MNEKTKKIINLIANLDFEYDRMSKKGQKTYDEICNLLNIQELPEGKE
tara:strand:- start:2701 stop:2844 length:144 start_codon:yes stop_codon:yes gene_type:complete